MATVRRAWRVSVGGCSAVIDAVAAAATRGHAIARTVFNAAEVGIKIPWVSVRAVRAPEYDRWAADMRRNVCWDEEFVKGWKTHA